MYSNRCTFITQHLPHNIPRDKPCSPLYGLATWYSYHYQSKRAKPKGTGRARKKFGSVIVVEYIHFLFYFLVNLPFLGEASWIQIGYMNAVFLSWYVLCPVFSCWWYSVRLYWVVPLLIIVLVSQQTFWTQVFGIIVCIVLYCTVRR